MILETIRYTADWFADPTYGVAAMLARLPLWGTDARPTGVDIVDETRDPDAALGLLPAPSAPGRLVVAVNLARDGVNLDASCMPPIADGQVPLVLRIGRQTSDSKAAIRDALYVSRATYWSLRRLMENDAAAATARGNGNANLIAILTIAHLAVTPFHQELQDIQLVATWLAVLNVRDGSPRGP